MSTVLSLRLNEGDMFVRLENESFAPALREALQRELPEVICTPITEDRMAFLRKQRQISSIFTLPFNKECRITVETAQSKERVTDESTSTLRGVITAIREIFPSSLKRPLS